MSTRCQIGVYEKDEKNLEKYVALLYRHSDGYPDGSYGVIAEIIDFLKGFKKNRGDDPEFQAARLMQCMINKYDSHDKEIHKESKSPEPYKRSSTGYGISNSLHGDLAYYYAIYPNKVNIYETGWDVEFKDMKLICSFNISDNLKKIKTKVDKLVKQKGE